MPRIPRISRIPRIPRFLCCGLLGLSSVTLSSCTWETAGPPLPASREAPVPSQRILLRGTRVLSREDRVNYPTEISDARRAMHQATRTPFEPYHICGLRPGQSPVYCATGLPVQGYWLNGDQYVVQIHAHREAIARARPPLPLRP